MGRMTMPKKAAPTHVIEKDKDIPMAFLIIAPTLKVDAWVREFRRHAPDLDLRVWPDTGQPSDITFVLSWKAPHGILKTFDNLKCIASLGAGVDHVLEDPDLPKTVPVTRVVEPSMAQYMREYVVMAVLNYCREWTFFQNRRAEAVWRPKLARIADMTTVGIMGWGQLGKAVGRSLDFMGFPVIGWRQTHQVDPDARLFHGPEAMDAFLGVSQVLVCLLPLTRNTRGVLNQRTFSKLPRGAYVINVARGEHLVEPDLLAALDSGHLSGACLDVFLQEPLPAEHPFWRHPSITVTPHISSITNPKKVVPQVLDNYRRIQAGEPLLHRVDPDRGY